MHLVHVRFISAEKAFRHGDIEGVLAKLAKTAGGAAASGGLLGFASSVLSAAKGGEKFGRMDVKRVYFVRRQYIYKVIYLMLHTSRETGYVTTLRYYCGNSSS